MLLRIPAFMAAALILCSVARLALAEEGAYYVYDGKTLQTVRSGDPREVAAVEWQVWLYTKDRPKGEPGRTWGMIIGKSAGEVMTKLKEAQEYERYWERYFKEPEGSTVLTYFNSLGPIAKVKPAKPTPEKASEVFARVVKYQNFFKRVVDTMNASKGKNPFESVGSVITEYAQSLVKAQEELRRLTPMLIELDERAMRTIDNDLEKIQKEFDNTERHMKKIEESWPKSQKKTEVSPLSETYEVVEQTNEASQPARYVIKMKATIENGTFIYHYHSFDKDESGRATDLTTSVALRDIDPAKIKLESPHEFRKSNECVVNLTGKRGEAFSIRGEWFRASRPVDEKADSSAFYFPSRAAAEKFVAQLKAAMEAEGSSPLEK